MRMPMMMVRVRWAFLARGSPKAMTPFETASTPVMAAQPLAKALHAAASMREVLHGGRQGWRRGHDGNGMAAGLMIVGRRRRRWRPAACRRRGRWGAMKAAPVSLTPRRLTMARMARMTRQSSQRCVDAARARRRSRPSTPAEMPTAAVRM